MHRRYQGILHVGHQRDARGPEARVLFGARNLLGELRREAALDGRDVYPHLFEYPAAHKAHDAAATGGTVIVLSFPAGALEAAGRSPAQALEVLALEFV